MKKKLLTLALTATMAFSTMLSAFAATADVTIDGAFSANTGDEALKGDFDITYTFKNKSADTSQNYNNFILEFYSEEVTVGTTGKGYMTLRADAAGWWAEGWGDDGGQTTTAPAFTKADGTEIDEATWTNWPAAMADADVTINATRSKETIKVTYKIEGANGDKFEFVTENTNVYGFGENVKVRLTGEKVALTDVKFKDNSADKEEDTTKDAVKDTEKDTTKKAADSKDDEDGLNPVVIVVIVVVAVVAVAGIVVATKKKN